MEITINLKVTDLENLSDNCYQEILNIFRDTIAESKNLNIPVSDISFDNWSFNCEAIYDGRN